MSDSPTESSSPRPESPNPPFSTSFGTLRPSKRTDRSQGCTMRIGSSRSASSALLSADAPKFSSESLAKENSLSRSSDALRSFGSDATLERRSVHKDMIGASITMDNGGGSTAKREARHNTVLLGGVPMRIPLRDDDSDFSVSSGPLEDESRLMREKLNEKFFVEFQLTNGTVVIERPTHKTMAIDVKKALLQKARDVLGDDTAILLPSIDANDYVLKISGTEEYVTNDQLPLHRVDFIQVCNKAFLAPKMEMILRSQTQPIDEEARKRRIVAELKLGTEIGSLVDSAYLHNFLEYENEEIADFRREVAKMRLAAEEAQRAKESSGYFELLPQYCHMEPLPLNIPERLSVVCYFPDNLKAQVACSPMETVHSLRETMFKKYSRIGGEGAKQKEVVNFVLKVTGLQEYLYGEKQLINFDCVRRFISQNEVMSISLVDRESLQDYIAELRANYHSIVDDLMAHWEEPKHDPNIEESIFSTTKHLSVKVSGVERALPAEAQVSPDEFIYMHVAVYHSGHKVDEDFTNKAAAGPNPCWNEWLEMKKVPLRNIARGCRICFTLYKRTCNASDPSFVWQKAIEKDDVQLGWVACQLIDHSARLRHGKAKFRMWTAVEVDPVGTCYQNLLQMNAPVLFAEFAGRPNGRTVYYPSVNPKKVEPKSLSNDDTRLRMESITRYDPVTELTDEDKTLLWKYRHYIMNMSSALPKFLLAINWNDNNQVREAHSLLHSWARPSPLQALELLDAKFADPEVRNFGVECLERMTDGEVFDFMLQLTQAVKHEPYHNSALAGFLLKRAWRNRHAGHSFFWFLKAEIHNAEVAERFTVLLEAYLRGCGNFRQQLAKQNEVVSQLVGVAKKIKKIESAERLSVLRESLTKLVFPARFQLPLDERLEGTGLMVEKCKYMDSKKLPLWLVWSNHEAIAKPINVIFKVGDDLRQDVLTLQVLRIMDKLWKNEGLDLRLKPYGCIATGDEIGMIEVVPNSKTTADINKEGGGTKAVLEKDTLTKWMRKHNPSEEEFKKAQENFLLSTAGYCVATFVLGIGDRHNDNIMITRDGHLFHIDFGHFLGNFKKKYGFKRERAPFVFTPQYAHVLGGTKHEVFRSFVGVCCRAFNILRKHSDMFINLFQMMLCTGIPELRNPDDIEYLRDAFGLGLSEEDAAAKFTKLIYSSLNTKTTVINDAIHVFVHS